MFFITMFVAVLFFFVCSVLSCFLFVCLFVLFSILNCSKSVKGDHEMYCFFITPSFSEPTRQICPAGNCRANKVMNVKTHVTGLCFMDVRMSKKYKREMGKNFFFISKWIVTIMQNNQCKEFKIKFYFSLYEPSGCYWGEGSQMMPSATERL